MKKLLLSAAAVSALTCSALAADLPSSKAPIARPQPPVWTGFYAGLNAGYTWGTNANTQATSWSGNSWKTYTDFTSPPFYLAGANVVGSQISNSPAAISQSGFLGGAQIGYNYQMKENLLLGLEADIQGAVVNGNGTTNGSLYGSGPGTRSPLANAAYNYYASQIGYASTNVSSGLNYLGTARGRVGYIISPALVVYATGGLAYGDAWANATTTAASNTYGSYTVTGGVPGVHGVASQVYFGQQSSANSLLVGYSAGGGAEWMFMPNWSLKTEVLYYNLGNMSLSTSSVAGEVTGGKVLNPNTGTESQFTTAAPGVMGTNVNVNYQGIIARAGVNYHFNFANVAPVVAKF